MEIILATTSKSRLNLFRNLGIPFSAEPSFVDEYNSRRPRFPKDLVQFLSKEKAEAVAKNHKDKDSIILGFDSVGYYNRTILEKPENREIAFNRLKSMNGCRIIYFTGIHMINPKRNKILKDDSETYLYLRPISDSEINYYLDQTSDYKNYSLGFDPLHHFSSSFISRIEGSSLNLLGLPLEKVVPMLYEMGYKF